MRRAILVLAAFVLSACAGDRYGEVMVDDHFSTGLVADRSTAIRFACIAYADRHPDTNKCPFYRAERDNEGNWDVRGDSGGGEMTGCTGPWYTVSGLDGHLLSGDAACL